MNSDFKQPPNERGFTLVELLIVMAIIAILASMAMTSYMKYRQKSTVTSHALPLANACAKDIITYCIGLDIDEPQDIDVSNVDLTNCKNQKILSYNLTINLTGSFTCNPGGDVSNGVVEAKLENVPDYKAVCYLKNNALVCKIEEQ